VVVEWLRDAMMIVLKDVRGISVKEDKYIDDGIMLLTV